jgi:hypothetical protein
MYVTFVILFSRPPLCARWWAKKWLVSPLGLGPGPAPGHHQHLRATWLLAEKFVGSAGGWPVSPGSGLGFNFKQEAVIKVVKA